MSQKVELTTFDARLFDGVSSRARQIVVDRDQQGNLTLHFEGSEPQIVLLRDYITIRPVGHSPIVLRMESGPEIHIAADKRSRAAFGLGVSKLTRVIEAIENRPLPVVAVVVSAMCVGIASYIYGLPMLAKAAAPRIPLAIKKEIGSQGLSFLDRVMFMPTQLSVEQQRRPQVLTDRLQEVVKLYPEPVAITRRMGHGDGEAANAMALLPYTIVATDKLVSSLNDAELEAVLAHEMGHLSLDHSTQSLVRGSAVSVATLVLFGGDPGVFQALAINLVDSKNSRDHEREADRFALDALVRRGSSPMALHAALKKISEGHEEAGLNAYLSSHPMTEDRLQAIEEFSRQAASPSR